MASGKKIGTDFTTGSIRKHLLIFVTPFLLSSILNSLYNATDMVIIGQFIGNVGTVAVSQGGKMLNLFTLVCTSLAGSGQVLIGQLLGAKKEKELNETIGTMFSILIGIAVFLSVVCLALSTNIIGWLNTPEESAQAALSYLRITCIGLPLVFAYNAVSTVLRGMGESKLPFVFIAIAAVFNIIGDIIFIVVFDMGVVGTAIATVMGQGISFVVSAIYLYRRRQQFGFDFKLKSFIPKADKTRIILKVGLPMAARSFCIQFSQLILIAWINDLGLVQAAAWGVADKFISLTNIVSVAVKSAGGSIIAQNLGGDHIDRCKSLVRNSIGLCTLVAVVLSAASVIFPGPIFRLFTKDADVVSMAPQFMWICCIIFVLAAVGAGYNTVINGSGNATLGFWEGFLDGVVLRLGLGYLFGTVLGMQVVGFFLGNALARLSPLVIGGVYYYSGAWVRRKRLSEMTKG